MISVIIPIYNVEHFLCRCINSIINQTLNETKEIILVDDGSDDTCSRKCDELILDYGNIVVIHQKNKGLSGARNTGIDYSSGEYICFIDSDDWVHPRYLEVMYDEITKSHGVDIVVSQYEETTTEVPFQKIDRINRTRYSNIDACGMLKKSENIHMTISWNKLYKRRLFDTIRFPVNRLHEDEFTTYKLLYNADSVLVVDSVLYYYFCRSNSIMHSPSLKSWIDGREALFERMLFFKNHGMSEFANTLFYDIECYILYRIHNDFENKKTYYNIYLQLLKASKGIIPSKQRLIMYYKYIRRRL